MRKIADNILETIGNTPLVRINKLNQGGAEVLAKVSRSIRAVPSRTVLRS